MSVEPATLEAEAGGPLESRNLQTLSNIEMMMMMMMSCSHLEAAPELGSDLRPWGQIWEGVGMGASVRVSMTQCPLPLASPGKPSGVSCWDPQSYAVSLGMERFPTQQSCFLFYLVGAAGASQRWIKTRSALGWGGVGGRALNPWVTPRMEGTVISAPSAAC